MEGCPKASRGGRHAGSSTLRAIDSADPGTSRLLDGPEDLERDANRRLSLLPALTTDGVARVRMPPALHAVLRRWLAENRDRAEPEPGVERVVRSTRTRVASELVSLSADAPMKKRILDEMKPLLEAWCGQPLEPARAYGVRVYRAGCVLYRHVDLLETDVVSAVLLIDQDVDAPWPLVVEGFDGSRRELVLEPGEAALYEGAKLPHHRDAPLRGRVYAAVFVHYTPRWWRYDGERVEDLVRALPPGYPRRSLAYGRTRGVTAARETRPTKYLAFDKDLGGWNNILMHFEIMVVLAWLTGRTLVLPPPQRFYLLGERRRLEDFVDLEALRRSLPVLTSEEFVEQSGLAPEIASHEPFHGWMHEHGHAPGWNALEDALVLPLDALRQRPELAQRLIGRRPVSLDHEVEVCDLLYFPTTKKHRMFGVAECFFLFGDERLARRARTLLRDAVRFRPEIVALAERALESPTLAGGAFSSLHVRRGDFQYARTQISAEEILQHTKEHIEPGETIYLATDEPAAEFFQPLAERYNLVRFDRLLGDVTDATPDHWRGVVEMLVCAAAPGRFIGTRLSTFTARIQTLRGHLSRVPNGDCQGIDPSSRYTQLPFTGEPDDAELDSEPWWRFAHRVRMWGRAYPEVWTELDD